MKYDKENLARLAKELEIYKIKANAPMAEYTSCLLYTSRCV